MVENVCESCSDDHYYVHCNPENAHADLATTADALGARVDIVVRTGARRSGVLVVAVLLAFQHAQE